MDIGATPALAYLTGRYLTFPLGLPANSTNSLIGNCKPSLRLFSVFLASRFPLKVSLKIEPYGNLSSTHQ